MMIKVFFYYFILVNIFTSAIFAQKSSFDPFPTNRDSKYAYTDQDIPNGCFFPISVAKWNGYEITNVRTSQTVDSSS